MPVYEPWDEARGAEIIGLAGRDDRISEGTRAIPEETALAQAKVPSSEGMVLLTSRVSVEMVQKTAAIGAPVIAAVSAPTALAVRMADAAGITLVAIARSDGFEIFTHPDRITPGTAVQGTAHVA